MVRRRILLSGGAAAVAAAAGYRHFRPPAEPVLPDAPAGAQRLEQRYSAARGRAVDFYTEVPAGHGDGRGLPVCLVLHGGSTTAADFPRLGLGRFLTDAVRRGAAPFVLAGATGGRLSWRPGVPDDPQRLVHTEIPRWCAARGLDTTRMAACGWSMGGYGALLLAAAFPGFLSAVAAFSPAGSRATTSSPPPPPCAPSRSGCGAAIGTASTTTSVPWPGYFPARPARSVPAGTTSATGRAACPRRATSSPVR